jgi:hypothetical protein
MRDDNNNKVDLVIKDAFNVLTAPTNLLVCLQQPAQQAALALHRFNSI